MEVLSTLVGVNFRPKESRDYVKELEIGDALYLEAEPDNPYDANAVKVVAQTGEHLGYLSRESNMEVAEHLANDGAYDCGIVGFQSTLKPTLRITLLDEDDDESFG